MTTRDFIAKTYGVQSTKERRCSSVFTDYKGNVYSYGYHYPLLFNVKGIWFINTSGYSNTTSKHIGWARSVCTGACPIELDRQAATVISSNSATDDEKHLELVRVATNMIDKVKADMLTKKRKDTQIYKYLEWVLDKALKTATTVATL